MQRPLVGDGRGAPGLLDDAVGEPVHVEDLNTAADGGVLDEQGELRVEGLGQVPGVRGQQDRRSRVVWRGCRPWLACLFRQEGRAVQGGDGLSGSGAPGHLGWTGKGHFVCDLALAWMQERPPGSERVSEDPLQFLRAGYKGNLARGAFHG